MPQAHHLSRALLDAFFQGDASRADLLAETIRAIEAECATCRRTLATGRIDYARAVQEASQRYRAALPELQAEHDQLPELLQALGATGPDNDLDTLLHVARHRRFHTTAFVSYQLAAGWTALDSEDRQTVAQARDLAETAASRLETARYGRPLVTELRAETELLRARLALAGPAAGHPGGAPDGGEVERALAAAAELAQAAASADLAAGVEIGRACAALRAGDPFTARRHLEQATRTAPRPPDSRWHLSRETLLARLERRAGDPAAASRRLSRIEERPPARRHRRTEWTAAREQALALLALGRRAEAEKAVARRRKVEGSAIPADLHHLEALTLPIADSPEALQLASQKLRAAFTTHLALGQGLRAATTVLDLLRLTRSSRPTPPPAPGHPTQLLEPLVARRPLPAPAVTAFATLARGLHHPTTTPTGAPDPIDHADDLLFALDPPWSPSPDDPPT
jgi:hypothetical protein